ncbi:MAG TPA: hypothetical protein PLH23_05790 [Hyphomonadaceae bacterium]|jgi:hypothetical protein|nr:hypothetical protein [Hyphomonadaceae bacterium]HPI47761.1 hypothetical protein [Hyphomonadaceae bacterium]
MKQSPIRRLRRDRSRLVQELALARGTGDPVKADELEKQIADLDTKIAGQEARQAQLGKS